MLQTDFLVVNTSLSVNIATTDFLPPPAVMRSAETPLDTGYFYFRFCTSDLTSTFYAYMHFAELRELKSNESTSFDIFVNGDPWKSEHIVLDYLATQTIDDKRGLRGESIYNFTFKRTENSALPPILNAIEFYRAVELSQPETQQGDGKSLLYLFIRVDVDNNHQRSLYNMYLCIYQLMQSWRSNVNIQETIGKEIHVPLKMTHTDGRALIAGMIELFLCKSMPLHCV